MACCPGSGASVLAPARSCDLWLTGEMSHHELLDAAHAGVSVILAEHSNSERGFLRDKLKERVERALNRDDGEAVTVTVSEEDRDPVQIV